MDEKCFFAGRIPAIVVEFPGLGEDAVAGDEAGDRVSGNRPGHRPAGVWLPDKFGSVLVADQISGRDMQQGSPDPELEMGSLQMKV